MHPARESTPLFGPFAGPKRREKHPAVRFDEGPESRLSKGLLERRKGSKSIRDGRDGKKNLQM
jgi:hypothetical protein